MDYLKIDTSQNIDIEQPIASVAERIAATMLDMLFILVFIAVTAFIAGDLKMGWVLFIVYIPVALYSLVSEITMNGQSWGKKILKIKVVKIDGSPTTFSSYFLRWIIRLIEVLITFGSLALITVILNRKGQRLGDIAANTTVIRLSEKSLKGTLFLKIPDNYTLVYPEVSQLTTQDIYTIQEVLELIRSRQNPQHASSISIKLRQAIEKKLNIIGKQDTPSFFHTIISDYNYINSRT